jgi:Na+-driven multidrug efflux pump
MHSGSLPPQVVIVFLLIAGSVVAGFVVLTFHRYWAGCLNSPNQLKRIGTTLLYFLASFLLPFCVAFILHDWLQSFEYLHTLYLSAPWQVRLLSFLALLVPLWLYVFFAFLRHARTQHVHASDP